MIKLTEKEARELAGKMRFTRKSTNQLISRIPNDKEINEFIDRLKKQGYIKKTALEEARTKKNEWDYDWSYRKGTIISDVNDIFDLYEKAIAEMLG
jgi:hypothetical protein